MFGRTVSGSKQPTYFNISILTLIGLAAIGWILVVWSTTHMKSPVVKLMMPMEASWSMLEVVSVWLMWAVMMGAMMLPSAMPMILIHRRISAARGQEKDGYSANAWFGFTYLVAWIGYSAVATLVQWSLQSASVLSSMLFVQNNWISGGIVIATGIFQLTPLKNACLNKCRTPIGFLMTEWRSGRRGAVVMGALHGGYCLACCWALMALLFVFGVMNLIVIATLATIVAIEKLVPFGDHLGRYVGILLIGLGGWMTAT